jgi:glutamyl-tRNA synthetase
MDKKIRVRFAPSPTGYLHVGGARSALFNYLFAKKTGGTFILRIEDTDQNRFVENACKEIYESLKWMGLDWDEGPEVGGNFGPYIQSERLDIYKKYAQVLLDMGHAYRCFCTPERIASVREAQEKAKQPAGYDKSCRNLSKEQIQENLDKGLPYVIRFKIPAGRTVAFNDRIRGKIEYSSDILDDLVLIKTDGFPTYHMANVVDDHLMEISHVLRGDEWIASTPRHVLIYEAFGWQHPEFAHLPVILSPDGGKLSKRKGAASVMDYKRGGFLPEALFNFLAFLGWSPGDDREKMPQAELIEAFSLDQVSPKASVLDEKKLEWMNGLYMAECSTDRILQEVMPIWIEKGWKINAEHLVKIIDMMKVRSKRLTELADNAFYFFNDPVEYEEKAARKNFTPASKALLETIHKELTASNDFSHGSLEALYRTIAEKTGVSSGQLIHPTRLSISGVSFGPGLFELMELLGKETVLRRIENAIKKIDGFAAGNI